ncbi:hypothetical protein IQ07DRAFT_531127 [Pyrenochaeta sp. DS3sAY3a]|nr:hypothetical protein IQ07DRAFT_531127 [Pyrenochaeta sp. DS3sAY3a]
MLADTDAASQQLLAEAHVSAPKPPSASAVVGATLVNAARARHRQSSPGTTVKSNIGKLKRPSLPVDGHLRSRVASRGNVFEIVLSPEKAPSKPAETDHVAPHNVHLELELPNGKPQCTAILYRYDKKMGPRHQQCQRPGTTTSSSSRLYCNNHAQKRPPERCGEPVAAEDAEDSTMTCHRISSTRTGDGPRCAVHAGHPGQDQSIISNDVPLPKRLRGRPRQVKIQSPPIRPKRRRDSEVEDQQPSDLQTSPAGLPVRKRSRQGSTEDSDPAIELYSPTQSDVLDSDDAPAPPVSSVRGTQKVRAKATTDRIQRSKGSKRRQSPEKEANGSKVDVNDKDDEDVEDLEREPQRKASSGSIHDVFRFLDLEERPGKCQTESGSNIKRACKRASSLLRSEDASIDDITEGLKIVRASLRAIRFGVDVPEEDRQDFKGDAYGYIFRALAQFLQDVFLLLSDLYDVPTDSLYAMRTLSSLTKSILLFKDSIVAWKVSGTQRYKGDRIIKDVDSHFIALLRPLAHNYTVRLSQLETERVSRQEQAELEQRLKEEADEEIRRIDIEAARRARLDRWQYLHLKRLQCEPDPFRRQGLQITKLEDLEDTDANGNKYERLSVFRTRSTPPLHWVSSATKARAWDQEQETVLLDSLKEFAGPDVFLDIFSRHCGRGGKLRSFRVVDIVAKAAWVRSTFLKLHQEKGWEVPEWIAQLQVPF